MSSGKLDTSGVFKVLRDQVSDTNLVLSASQVAIRKNGLEFLSNRPFSIWAEVNIELRLPLQEGTVRGSGVVVDCNGSPQTGYVVALLFVGLSRQAQDRLNQVAQAPIRA
jgi:hypothetical protein